MNKISTDLRDGTSQPRQNLWLKRGCVGALLVVMIFMGWVRLRLRTMPLERDEGEFAYVGQLMLQGIPPYKLASNMKLPGTYAAYAAIMAVFGETAAGIRIGLMLVSFMTAALVFLLGKRLYGPLAGAVAGMTYTFLSFRPAVLGVYAHATQFVVLAALAGILLLLRAIESGRTALFFGSGLCFGLAFLMKQPGILFAVFAGFYWLWQEWRRPFPWRNVAWRGGALFAGLALPYAVTCLIVLRAGVFSSFWFWTWSYAREYGTITTLADVRDVLRAYLPWVIRPLVIWEIIALGVAAPLWTRHARRHWGFVTSFCLFSCLAVCPGFYFRPHYYVLLLPAAALCAGVAVSVAHESLRERRLGTFMAWLPVLYFAVAFGISLRAEYNKFWHLDPVFLVRKMQPGEAFPEAVAVGGYLKTHSSPQDTIAIFGSEPEICFYSARHCATSYLYSFPLTEKQKFARQMQQDMMRQIQDARPEFVVYVDDIHSWGANDVLESHREFLETAWDYSHRGYQLAEQVEIAGEPAHLWGEHASLYVFQRTENRD